MYMLFHLFIIYIHKYYFKTFLFKNYIYMYIIDINKFFRYVDDIYNSQCYALLL